MKIRNCYNKLPVLSSLLLILLTSFTSSAKIATPAISIVTDKIQGVADLHGIDKLTTVLHDKNIKYEKVVSLKEAKGNLIIVIGLSLGDGEAAKMLKSANHQVPQVSEALTIWKTKFQNKTIWVISGFDDRGLMYGLLDVADRINWSTDNKNLMSNKNVIFRHLTD